MSHSFPTRRSSDLFNGTGYCLGIRSLSLVGIAIVRPSVVYESYEIESHILTKGFDPHNSTSNWSKRSKWGYHQMISFWITNIWEHESIAPFDTITRIDSDSCWTQPLTMDGPGQFLPGLPHGKVYYANHLLYDAPFVTKNFVEFTRAYIAKNNLTLMNPELLKSHLSLDNLTCITYNNFEVTLVDFMLRPQVKKWHYQITNEAPFNIYKIAGEMPLNGLPL